MSCLNKFSFNSTIYLPDGLKAKPNEFITFANETTNFVRIIFMNPKKSRDEGNYKCEASNGSSSVFIEKKLKFVSESFLKLENSSFTVFVEKKAKASFIIPYNAFPPPKFILYKTSTENALKNPISGLLHLSENQTYTKFNQLTGNFSETKITITMDNVELSQSFNLKAKNPGNTEFAYLKIHVHGKFFILFYFP